MTYLRIAFDFSRAAVQRSFFVLGTGFLCRMQYFIEANLMFNSKLYLENY